MDASFQGTRIVVIALHRCIAASRRLDKNVLLKINWHEHGLVPLDDVRADKSALKINEHSSIECSWREQVAHEYRKISSGVSPREKLRTASRYVGVPIVVDRVATRSGS